MEDQGMFNVLKDLNGTAVRGELACNVPPPGWHCTRKPGHDGPCAAVPADTQWEELFRDVAIALNCLPSSFIDGNEHVLKQAKRFTSFFLASEGQAQTSAAVDVVAERRRQVCAEGLTPEHDDEHDGGEMGQAAACYACPELVIVFPGMNAWPWEDSWWKPRDRRSDLVRAGALILAEIERIDRVAAKAGGV